MALFVRILVVLFAFLVASFTAAMVITFGMVMDWEASVLADNPFGPWAVFGLFGFAVSGMGLFPSFLVIVLTETFNIRSVLFYTVAGGLGLAAFYYGFSFASRRELEIMAAAGIVAGFVYWSIAGRKAGMWREPAPPPPPVPDASAN